jgi:hypothetical protein
MSPLEMDVYMDKVVIEGQVLKRPGVIHRSWWMELWEAIKNKSCPHCGRKPWNG